MANYHLHAVVYGEQLSQVKPILSDTHLKVAEYGGLACLYSMVDTAEELYKSLKESYVNRGHLSIAEARKSWYAQLQTILLQLMREEVELIPFAFGTLFTDAEQMRIFIEENQETLIETLEEVRFYEEYHLTFSYEEPSPLKSERGSGKEYFLAKYQKHKLEEEFRERLQDYREELKKAFPINLLNVLPNAQGSLRGQGAILLRREEAVDLQATCIKMLNENSKLRIELTGPWPPYLLGAKASSGFNIPEKPPTPEVIQRHA